MARASASTFKLSGLPSAVLPLDMVVEAEAIGAPIDFRENSESAFPGVAKPLLPSTKVITSELADDSDVLNRGRIKLVCEALELLKEDIGRDAVVGGMIPGPFTLLLFLVEPGGLFTDMKRNPNAVEDALSHLASCLSRVARAYRSAGADFITVHDMGASPGFIGPARYEQFAFPAERLLIEQIPKPRVLSLCGNTNKSMNLLAATGADALSVDQLNQLDESRKALDGMLLFGNVDPVAVLWRGDEAAVTESVRAAKQAGVDAVWPGCDLVLQSPLDNIRALTSA